jgi:hypothetical protein
MKRHSFPLGRVLDWKTVIAQQEQTALEALQKKESDIESSLLSLNNAIRGLCDASQEAVTGHELACSVRARNAVQKQKAVTQQDHAACQTQIVAQQKRFRVVETERRLFDKLRERSHFEWQAGVNREINAEASDLYLGVWGRR